MKKEILEAIKKIEELLQEKEEAQRKLREALTPLVEKKEECERSKEVINLFKPSTDPKKPSTIYQRLFGYAQKNEDKGGKFRAYPNYQIYYSHGYVSIRFYSNFNSYQRSWNEDETMLKYPGNYGVEYVEIKYDSFSPSIRLSFIMFYNLLAGVSSYAESLPEMHAITKIKEIWGNDGILNDILDIAKDYIEGITQYKAAEKTIEEIKEKIYNIEDEIERIEKEYEAKIKASQAYNTLWQAWRGLPEEIYYKYDPYNGFFGGTSVTLFRMIEIIQKEVLRGE